MPQRSAGFGIHRFEGLRIVSKENQTATGSHGAAAGVAGPNLGIFPSQLFSGEVECEQDFLKSITGTSLRSCRIVGMAWSVFVAGDEHDIAVLQRQKIKKAC